MITLKQIIERFQMPIPKKIRDEINKWIHLPEPQRFIKQALKYNLDDSSELYNIGKQKGKYPRLYYLCRIYIHPLTIAQAICRIANKN